MHHLGLPMSCASPGMPMSRPCPTMPRANALSHIAIPMPSFTYLLLMPCPALPMPPSYARPALPMPPSYALPCQCLLLIPCPANASFLCPALPCPANASFLCPALPCPALPCPALPCPALPCQCQCQCHTMPCQSPALPNALPCHANAVPVSVCAFRTLPACKLLTFVRSSFCSSVRLLLGGVLQRRSTHSLPPPIISYHVTHSLSVPINQPISLIIVPSHSLTHCHCIQIIQSHALTYSLTVSPNDH